MDLIHSALRLYRKVTDALFPVHQVATRQASCAAEPGRAAKDVQGPDHELREES